MFFDKEMRKNKKKNRILIVTPYWMDKNLDGAERVNKEIALFLKKNKFEVYVLTSNSFGVRYFKDLFSIKSYHSFSKNEGNEKKKKIFRLPHNKLIALIYYLIFGKFFLFLGIKNFLFMGPILPKKLVEKIFNRYQFDLVYAAPLPLKMIQDVVEVVSKIKSNKPLLILRPDFKKSINYFSKNNSIMEVFKKSDFIHVTTNAQKKDIIKMYKVKPKKIIEISHFIDIKKLTPIEELEKDVFYFKKKYKLIGKKIILFLGRKDKSKGVYFLFKAIRKLYHKDKKYILLFAGKDNMNWTFFKKLNKDFDKFAIDLGYVEEKDKEIVFASCDVFCLPSINDSFGLVYLEAWHKKKPVIGAAINPIRELIETNKGGYCVSFGNVKQLKDTIEILFKNNKLRKRLGENGFKALINKYTLDAVKNKFLDIFSQNNYG